MHPYVDLHISDGAMIKWRKRIMDNLTFLGTDSLKIVPVPRPTSPRSEFADAADARSTARNMIQHAPQADNLYILTPIH